MDEKDTLYSTPAVVFEADLETQAGSTLNLPSLFDPADN